MLDGIKIKLESKLTDQSLAMRPEKLRPFIPLTRDTQGIVIDYCCPIVILTHGSITYIMCDDTVINIQMNDKKFPTITLNAKHRIRFDDNHGHGGIRVSYHAPGIPWNISPLLKRQGGWTVEFQDQEIVVAGKTGKFLVTKGKKAIWHKSEGIIAYLVTSKNSKALG